MKSNMKEKLIRLNIKSQTKQLITQMMKAITKVKSIKLNNKSQTKKLMTLKVQIENFLISDKNEVINH